MSRLLGVEIPQHKVLYVALCSVYGIGEYRAFQICKAFSLNPQSRAKEVDETTLHEIAGYIKTQEWLVGPDLRRDYVNNIMSKIADQTHVGKRHQKGLPARSSKMRRNGKTGRKLAKQFAQK
jgi:small subunit ribosomal protein S13